jgi:serine protease Do
LTDAFANAAAAIRPSVVRIDVEGERQQQQLTQGPGQGIPPDLQDLFERFFDFGGRGPALPAPGPMRGTGSGVIIDEGGHVLTNNHVIARAAKVTITTVDGRKHDGQVVGRDPLTDLGVVRFTKKPDKLTMARLGRSESLRVGQWVLAVGSPLGLAQTVTAGIVSGLESGRNLPVSGQRVRQYIQTDAAINPGNSGGPLVNLTGEVVGINTFINVGPGGAYGYAVAMDQAAPLSRTLIKDGRVRYPYLGVQVADVDGLSPELRRQAAKLPEQGAFVAEVTPDSPAQKAGLRTGDVIVAINGKQVTKAGDVVDLVSSLQIGATVNVEYLREGQKRSAKITLAELPGEDQARAGREGPLGLSLQTLTPSLARSLGVGADTRGALIAEVRSDSPAEKAGLQPGDVILEIDRQAVSSADQAANLLAERKTHLLRLKSAERSRFVTLPPP